MQAVAATGDVLSTVEACAALGVARASYYRLRGHISHVGPGSTSRKYPRRTSPRALTAGERQSVLDVLHHPDHMDQAVPQVHSALLDQGTYLCSARTMYRILDAHGEVRERRDQLRHPAYAKPELLATAPNQVWSWDITKLRGPVKWSYFYLYVLLDIFSRYVVGWLVARRQSAALARQLIEHAYVQQGVVPGQVTVHGDHGAPMISKALALLLADLGITKSHSRPHVSDDNPFSEAQFKTLKYRPDYPEHFGSLEHSRVWGVQLFDWYNHRHYHSGLGWMTPADVHYGRAEAVRARRAQVLDAAYQRHPERFVRKPPTPPALPAAVWINPPHRQSVAALQ